MLRASRHCRSISLADFTAVRHTFDFRVPGPRTGDNITSLFAVVEGQARPIKERDIGGERCPTTAIGPYLPSTMTSGVVNDEKPVINFNKCHEIPW